MDSTNKNKGFVFFWDIFFPFCSVSVFFWICLWRSAVLTWDLKMYMALLIAVFFNYFLIKFLNRTMKGQNTPPSLLYVLLWEIIAPLGAICLVFFSLVMESEFYKWDVLMKSKNETNLYIAVIMIFLFSFFLRKGLFFLAEKKG